MRRASFACFVALTIAACGGPPPDERPRAVRHDIALPRDTTLVRGLVPHNTTLDTMLREHGLPGDAVHAVIAAVRTAFDPRRLRSLQPFALERTRVGPALAPSQGDEICHGAGGARRR